MSVRVLEVTSPRDDDSPLAGLEAMCRHIYLDGFCYELAVALHRMTDWPIWALAGDGYKIRHAFVKDPEGKFHDARGAVPEEWLGAPFGLMPPNQLCQVTLEDLREVRPVEEFEIEKAIDLARRIWPEKMLRPDCEVKLKRYKAFLEGLEELSRKTGVWIRASFPATHVWPVLDQSAGDEDGYDLSRTEVPGHFVFDRRLS